MLVVIEEGDPHGPRVLPPFDGLLPGSPPCGPLIEVGGRRYDVFLTFGAVGPGAVLEVGNRLNVAGVVWPPVSGHVEGEILSPSGKRTPIRTPSDAMGVFDGAGPVAGEPGVWRVSAEGVCTGKTSVGVVAEHVDPGRRPRGGGLGLRGTTFPVPVVPESAESITFDLPPGTRADPPHPYTIRGRLPEGCDADTVGLLASLPGRVIDERFLAVRDGAFEYRYDPGTLRERHPNLDTRIGRPHPHLENAPAWFDTVTFTFWAGEGDGITAGVVVLQGEEVFPSARSGEPQPARRGSGLFWPSANPADFSRPVIRARPTDRGRGGRRSSLLALTDSGRTLYAVHPWSGELVRMDVSGRAPRVVRAAATRGEPRSVAILPGGREVVVALPGTGRISVYSADALREIRRFEVPGEPWAVLPSRDGKGFFVADFDGDRVLRIDAKTGAPEGSAGGIDRPACLALSPGGKEVFTVSSRTGAVFVLDTSCRLLRKLDAPSQLNQCRTVTPGPDGRLYAPQTRSDTVVGGLTFDRTVFPAVAVADPRGGRVSIRYFPDLLVVPPHRPVEVEVDGRSVYMASSGSDDVLAMDRGTGNARWHARDVGLEPGGLVMDRARSRLYVLTITGQKIVVLDANSGERLAREYFAHDPTPARIARGRYLFGTATDPRLTQDRWMSCAACHPEGDADGRTWNFGSGPLVTRSLRGCLKTTPLHVTGHLDEIQDTVRFTRRVMAGRWFVPEGLMREPLGRSNAGLDEDLDALAAYVASLEFKRPPLVPAASRPLIERGRRLFFAEETGCARCHPPPFYTDSGRRGEDGKPIRYDVGTRLPSEGEDLRRLDTPTLLGLRRSGPYLHDGRAKTLEEVFTKYNAGDRHGRTSHLTPEEIHALCEYMRTLRPP
jgi:DNA-binding beta-propeller fold protein YncE